MKATAFCIIYFGFILSPSVSFGQKKNSQFLKDLLWSEASPQLKDILQQPNTSRYQLIYTKIDRNKNNNPHFQKLLLQLRP